MGSSSVVCHKMHNARTERRPSGRGRSSCLITLALNGCFTALNPDALRLQIRRALRFGIDRREILQVLQMTAHLGVHACAIGVPLLMDAMDQTTSKSPAVGAKKATAGGLR